MLNTYIVPVTLYFNISANSEYEAGDDANFEASELVHRYANIESFEVQRDDIEEEFEDEDPAPWECVVCGEGDEGDKVDWQSMVDYTHYTCRE